jgi:hypothetical protein
MPVPVGGAIADGTYVLAQETFYGPGCPSGEQDRNTWLVCGATWQTAQEYTAPSGTVEDHFYNLNVSVAGTSLMVHGICGFTQDLTFQYDATATTLTLYVGGGTGPGTGRVDLYTLQ